VSIEFLYPQVSEAIRRAEILEDRGDPGASSAYLEVSLIEERIAEALPASDPEGALARRGAVRAAAAAKDPVRTQQLVDRFFAEAEGNVELQAELLQFLADLYRQLAAAQPADFEHDLALVLGHLSFSLSALGRLEEALAPSEEAIAIWRRLAATQPDIFRLNLEYALFRLSGYLRALGRWEDALTIDEERTRSYHQATARPTRRLA
jgi:tetratricopeptide (TPR) repeat protein